jgi:circadian clock protein KaiC
MNDKVTIERLASGVPGLDEVLGGGIPAFSFNVIAGQPGCGKTTLAHQIMFALATPQRSALYFTVLGEPPLKMLRYQQQFDFFEPAAINRSIRFVSLAAEVQSGDLDSVLARISEQVREWDPALVVVDSFRSIVLDGGGAAGHRLAHFVQQLGVLMSTWHATTFLVGEYEQPGGANPVFTVADGLIWLHQSVQRDSMVRKMEVLKMRGQACLPGLHTYRISAAGVEVFAPAAQAQPRRASLPRGRISSGNATLDAMLGGGVPHGYSVLVAGPSGSGKSILAASFLAEGARLGEKGVIAAFEQQPGGSRHHALAALIARGDVALLNTRAPDLSIDEVLKLLLTDIARLGASRVVIDSLSGFELAIAPDFRQDFRESLARMVSALADAGVTVLMTSEIEDRYTDLRFSPYGTAFLTDAIIVQRYIEFDSRLRRVMAVVKVRASAHCDELRLYTIDDGGIHIGGTLPRLEGLLGGQPARPGTTATHRARHRAARSR